MDFSALARTRQSVRAYHPDPVTDDDLAAILEAARLAPTACSRQPFRIFVLTTANHADLERVYRRPWFRQAPLVLAVCAVPAEGGVRADGKNHAEIDAAIVMDHLTLAAADRGLGTCWVCNFDPIAAREVLALPEGMEPVAFTPLGRPADSPREKVRRPLDELVIRR